MTVSYFNEVWDLGGQSHLRTYWRLYYTHTDGIVFVVDANDVDRIDTAKEELDNVIQASFFYFFIK
jgi:GTPase SAR1 family protein